jgi:hypothetical protein
MRWLRYLVGLWYVIELPVALLGAVALWRGNYGKAPIQSMEWISGLRRRAFPGRAAALGRFGAFWSLLLAASFTGVHIMYWTDMRMRTPMMPAIAIAAAAGMAWVVGRVLGRK